MEAGAMAGKIDLPMPMYVTPAADLASLVDVGRVTALHSPDWDYLPDHESVVLVGTEEGRVFQFTVGDGARDHYQVEFIDAHEETVVHIASSSKAAFTISYDGLMKEWHDGDALPAADPRLLHTYDAGLGPLQSILLMTDEIYTGTMSGLIAAWHALNKTLLRCFSVSPNPVTSLCAYNRLMIVSGSADGHVTLWMRKDGYAVREMRSAETPITDLCVDPNGFAFSCSARNQAVLRSPEVVRTAADIKARSEAMLAEANKAKIALSPRSEADRLKRIQSRLAIAGSAECVSWDLTTGWKEQQYPKDATCLQLHSFENTGPDRMTDAPEGKSVGVLISGHQRGAVNVWLTQNRSTDTLSTMRDLDKWNRELEEAVAHLERLQNIENKAFQEAIEDKNAKRQWFGLSAILTAGQKGMVTPNPCGLKLLQAASQPILHRPLVFVALREVLRNSIEADPETRRWSGLSTLQKHIMAEQLAPLLSATEAVKKQQEILAVLRERSTALDRNATELLNKGQLLKTLRGLKAPITCISACGLNVIAGCALGVATWDLKSGRHRESFTGLSGIPRHVVLRNNVVWAIDDEVGVQAWWSALLGSDLQNPAHTRRVAAKPQQHLLLLPDYTAAAAANIPALAIPQVATSDAEYAKLWTELGPNAATGTVPLDEFVAYYNKLEHCGVGPFSATEIARMMRMKPAAASQGVTYEQFAVCMARYAAR